MSYVRTLRTGDVNIASAGLKLTPEDVALLQAGNRDARNRLAGACIVASANAERSGNNVLAEDLLGVASLLMGS